MDLRYLNAFVKVCDAKSFTVAALSLGLTQPAVSKQIRRLEQDLGVPLFNRDDNGISLTDAGREAYRTATQILAEWTKLTLACKPYFESLQGTLSIGSSTTPARHLLLSHLQQFHAVHPHVTLRVQVEDSQRTLDALLQSEIDIAFVGIEPHSADLVRTPLASDRLVVVASASYNFHDDWRLSPFLLREDGSGTGAAAKQALADLGVDTERLNVVARLNSSTLVLDFVAAGLGLAVISSWEAAQAVRQGRIQVVADLNYRREFHVVTRRVPKQTELTDAFLHAIAPHSSGPEEQDEE
ncbi:MAG: LysR family transcriptional regulator [Alicyclobacillaceae bacterium]|nr:LysR family transcriptional regulator [Alicyclobacillaceae bacterium]